MPRIAAFLVLAVVAAGCGSSHAFDGERCNGVGTFCQHVGEQQAVREVRAARRDWLRELHENALKDTTRRFAAPPPAVLRRRLGLAAAANEVRIVSVTWRRGAQRAPDIVLESNAYARTSRALPQILDAVDPPPRSNRRVYEGIFIEAVDAQHVPYVAVYDALRDHVMGAQWARADDLYPYAHG